MTKSKQPRILFYDLETSPLKAYIWGLGKQAVRAGQLDKKHNSWGIICATYCWNDGKKAEAIDWGYEEQDTAKVVAHMDELIKQADVVIGKNSDKFDNKMLNAQRMLHGLPGMPTWAKYTDDLEKQMRKHFRLPSQALDYISEKLGFGGKIKMEFQDWIDIVEKNKDGAKKLEKMVKYGKKDVEDTRAIWNKLSEHFEPKFNVGLFRHRGYELACKQCGSLNVKKNGTRQLGLTRYQEYLCIDCGRYAGKTALDKYDEHKNVLR